jgi:transposase
VWLAGSTQADPGAVPTPSWATRIPEPADQAGHRKRCGSAGGRPPAFDAEDYKGRNVIERGFNLTKQWRGLATCYDKLALTYRGGAALRAITIWLRE